MTMREVVTSLQSRGHQVSFYVRKDGGILIKSIDGQRFPSGAKGNKIARFMVGENISEARSSQLKFATRQRKYKRPVLDDEVRQEWQRVKKKWNRAFKAKGGKPHPAGYFGWKRINDSIKNYGKDEALRRIREAERYASGIAYSKNVEILAQFVKNAAINSQSDDLMKLADDIVMYAYSIKEEWIQPAYDELYKLNKGISPKQVAENTRKVLRLKDAN